MGGTWKGRRGYAGSALLVAVAALYLLAMPLHFVTHDAADELNLILGEHHAYRSNHLLLTQVYRSALAFARELGFEGPAFIPPQLVNVLAGVSSVTLAFHLAWSITRSAAWSCLLAMLVGSSHLWFHASALETGALGTSLLFGAVFIAWRNQTPKSVAWTGASWGLACLGALFALNQVVLLPAFALGLFLDLRRDQASPVRHIAAAALALAFCLAFPLVIGANAAGIQEATGLIGWLSSHADQQRLTDVSFGVTGLLRSSSGFLRLWLATNSGPTVLKAAFSGVDLRDVGLLTWLGLGAALSIAGLVSCICVTGLFASTATQTRQPWLWVCAVAVTTVWLFGGFWLGSDPQFWLPALPFLVPMLATGVQKLRAERPRFDHRGKLAIAVCCGVMWWVNAPRETPSALFPTGGPSFQHAEHFSRQLSGRDLVLTPGAGWAIYARHYVEGLNVVNLSYADDMGESRVFLENLTHMLDVTWQTGGEVYFDGLRGPMLGSQVGYWNMVSNARGVGRDQLSEFLGSLATIVPSGFDGVYRLAHRSHGPPARQPSGLTATNLATETIQ